MADQQKTPAQQEQASVQSAQQGAKKSETGKPRSERQNTKGIGSSQGQDLGSPAEQQSPRPSAGTADIERSSGDATNVEGTGSRDSLVNDPTGAFKERP